MSRRLARSWYSEGFFLEAIKRLAHLPDAQQRDDREGKDLSQHRKGAPSLGVRFVATGCIELFFERLVLRGLSKWLREARKRMQTTKLTGDLRRSFTELTESCLRKKLLSLQLCSLSVLLVPQYIRRFSSNLFYSGNLQAPTIKHSPKSSNEQ